MTLEAIGALEASAFANLAAARPAAAAGATGFDTLLGELQQLNHQMHANDRTIQSLALGGTDNLHQVMMTLERTRLAFELALQVRNKALEAYQELMRMQV